MPAAVTVVIETAVLVVQSKKCSTTQVQVPSTTSRTVSDGGRRL